MTNFKFTIEVAYKNRRNGFAHEATLTCNGSTVEHVRLNYINRTWESYPFRSAKQTVVSMEIEKHYNRLKDEYKQLKGYKVMSLKRSIAFEKEILSQNEYYQQLLKFKSTI